MWDVREVLRMKEKMFVGTEKTQAPLGDPRDSVTGASSWPHPCTQKESCLLISDTQVWMLLLLSRFSCVRLCATP